MNHKDTLNIIINIILLETWNECQDVISDDNKDKGEQDQDLHQDQGGVVCSHPRPRLRSVTEDCLSTLPPMDMSNGLE